MRNMSWLLRCRGLSAAAAALLLAPFILAEARAEEPTGPTSASPARRATHGFTVDANEGYGFDTGVLRGTLRADGKALGLTTVVHVPSGKAVSGPYGLLSLYRVFSGNHRFGTAAWDWPSTARLLDLGAVEVHWPADAERPFDLRAVYRWHDAATLDTTISVTPERALPAFEVFLASYFDGSFADPFVYVSNPPETDHRPALLLARQAYGDWQMFPRNDAAVAIIRDGRWEIEPHPVEWAILPRLAAPLAVRRAAGSGLVGVLMAPAADCFAIATPYVGETHYSVYLSLFGYDLTAGQTRHAKARFVIGEALSDAELIKLHQRLP
jgi:hypothetical protein